jgi:hypothetical protein
MICYIPSKGRPATLTYKIFEEVGIEVIHFIEPQEIDLYDVPNKVSIERNNIGISYVRNYMLDYAKLNNHEWVIFCDDDVVAFYKYINGKNVRQSGFMFLDVFEKIKTLNYEVYGFNYNRFIWVADKTYSINSATVEQCVILHIPKIKWRYRGEFDLKEDRDFILQCIKYGKGVLRFNKIGISSPGIGENKGGLNEDYKINKDNISATKLILEWHPFALPNYKGGRFDAKLKLKELAKHYKKIVK